MSQERRKIRGIGQSYADLPPPIADCVRISRFAFARILTGTSSRAPSTLTE